MTLLTPDPDADARARSAHTSASASVIGHERETLAACYGVLARMRAESGLFVASPSADYSKAWIRDNFYEAMPYLGKPTQEYERTYDGLLAILRRHEYKIDAILRAKPSNGDEYIHARFDAATLREIPEPWGNRQNDATGALLFGIAQGMKQGKRMLRDDRDRRLVQKLVRMHGALAYWADADNGMWEEAEEVHASSIGAVVAGLREARDVGFEVEQAWIDRGTQALRRLLPRESTTKPVDMALLSLVWPYRVVTPDERRLILREVEGRLLRERGVIRYEGDSYYSRRAESLGRDRARETYVGDEAEWTMGLPWLSLIYREMGWSARADHFLDRTYRVQTAPGVLPELYYARSAVAGPNTPLGWSVAMFILALESRSQP